MQSQWPRIVAMLGGLTLAVAAAYLINVFFGLCIAVVTLCFAGDHL